VQGPSAAVCTSLTVYVCGTFSTGCGQVRVGGVWESRWCGLRPLTVRLRWLDAPSLRRRLSDPSDHAGKQGCGRGCSVAALSSRVFARQGFDSNNVNQSIASFLVTRPPIAFLGFGWESDMRNWRSEFLFQVGPLAPAWKGRRGCSAARGRTGRRSSTATRGRQSCRRLSFT
jgi:hypothetical protein